MPWTSIPDSLGQGPQGARGAMGGWSLPYKFEDGTTAPPMSGRVVLNNADPTLVDQIFIHKTDRFGNDLDGVLAEILEDDGLKIFAEGTERKLAFYKVVDVTEESTYYDVAVVYQAGDPEFVDVENLGIGIARQGPQGIQGEPGMMQPLLTGQADPGPISADGLITFMIGAFTLTETSTIVLTATAKSLQAFEDEVAEFYYTLEKDSEGETEYEGVIAHMGLNDADGLITVPASFTRRHFLAAGLWTLRLYYRSNLNFGNVDGPFTFVVHGWPGTSI